MLSAEERENEGALSPTFKPLVDLSIPTNDVNELSSNTTKIHFTYLMYQGFGEY